MDVCICSAGVLQTGNLATHKYKKGNEKDTQEHCDHLEKDLDADSGLGRKVCRI